MDTFTKMEAELELVLRDWAKALDEIEAEEAEEEKILEAEIAAARAEAKAKVQRKVTDMHSKYEAARDKLEKTMDAQAEKLNAALDRLDAEIAGAPGKLKADLEATRAKLRSNRTRLQARMQANLETQLKHIESQIYEMEAWADFVGATMSEKIKDQTTRSRQQVEVVKRDIQRLKESDQAAWNENKARVDRAMAHLKEGHQKAIAEFKKPTV